METVGIVALAFGVPDTIEANKRIAFIASHHSRELSAPIFTQADVFVEPRATAHYICEEPHMPPPTLRMARESVLWAKEMGIRSLILVAAKPHLRRALRDIRYAIREAGLALDVLVCEEVSQSQEVGWYCPDSTQKRTRSKWNWWTRELFVLLLPFCIYKRLST
jgi:hypothetical protein